MSRKTGLAWLTVAWLLLGAALLVVSAQTDAVWTAPQADRITVDPVTLTVSEPAGSGSFTLTLTSEPTAMVFVSLTASTAECSVVPAAVGLDAENWGSGVTATVTGVDDEIADGPQVCVVETGPAVSGDPAYAGRNPDDVTVTVLDEDEAGIVVTPTLLTVSEPDGSGSFTLTLTSEPTATVFVSLTASGDECSVSPGSVSLDAESWGSGVTATVTAVDDEVADGPQVCVVETGPAVSGDPAYVGRNPDDMTVTVLDDDEAGMVVTPTLLTVSEPDGSGSFTLTLTSQPTAMVSVSLTASGGECTVSPGSVSLDAESWGSGVTATVTAMDDEIADGPQVCVVETGPAVSADPVYAGVDAADVTVTVLDDDEAGIVVTPTLLTVSEPDGSGSFTLTLTSQPTATVSVSLTASGGECTVSPGSVSLDAESWGSGVTATVTAMDDEIADGPQSCVVQTGPAVSGDPVYAGVDAADVTVTVLDDDEAGIVVTPTLLTIGEPDGSGSFTLTLTSQPTATVSVPLMASGDECDVWPGSVSLDAETWASGVTATVTAVDDDIDDGDQVCPVVTGLAGSTDGHYNGLNPDDVTVIVGDNDAAGVSVTPTSLTVSEPNGSAIFVIALTSRPLADVTIPLSASNTQCQVFPGSVTLTSSTWQAGVNATVTAVDDAIADGDQTCLAVTGLTGSIDGHYNGLNPDDVTVTVGDDDTAGVSVTPTSLAVSEPDGWATFVIAVTSQPTAAVTIPLSASNTECQVFPNSVTLDASNQREDVTVLAHDDDIADGDQTCLAVTGWTTSADAHYNDLNPDDVTVIVHDNETAGVSVTPTSLAVSEPNGSAAFVIALFTPPLAGVTVPLSASNTQCQVSPDSITLTSSNWEAGVSATVTAVDDDIDDGDQVCLAVTGLTASTDGHYSGLNPDDVTVTVGDNDTAGVSVTPTNLTISEPNGWATFVITLTSQPLTDVTVPLSASNTQCQVSPDSVTLTSSTWQVGVSATVTAVDDEIADGPQTCLVQTGPVVSDDPAYAGRNPDDVTVTVLDNDEAGIVVTPTLLTVSEPDGSGSLTLTLTSQPMARVSVPLTASGDECSVWPKSVSLDAESWASGVTATVTAVDDEIADGTQSCLVETGPAVSTDPAYVGRNPNDVAVTVLDDDEAGIVVTPTLLTVSEPDGSGSFTLTLMSQPMATVSVLLTVSGDECIVSPGSVSLDAESWASGVTATVTAVDDEIADGPQSCLVETGPAVSTDPAYAGQNPDDVTVTVLDDDEAGIVVTPTLLTVSEPDGSGSFTLTLMSQPMATVSVLLTASGDECSVWPGSVSLDAGSWAGGVTATVTAVDDGIADGPQTCLVETGPAVSGDPVYAGLDAADVTVTVLDDDEAGIVVTPTLLTVSEPDGSGSFTLTLMSQPMEMVSVLLTASGDECSVWPGSVSLDAGSWARGVTATATAVDDEIADGPQVCVVQTGPAVSGDPVYAGLDADDVTVTVLDDDRGKRVYLPLVTRNRPVLLNPPTLYPIDNPDGDGTYSVGWSPVSGAVLYILEESNDIAFSGANEIYSGALAGFVVTQRGAGRHYYRVKARNDWGESGWSNVESVIVLWEAEPNDEPIQANGPLVSGLTYFGTFPSVADLNDYYYFDLAMVHSVELWLTHIPLAQNCDLVLRDSSLDVVGYSGNYGSQDEHILTNSLPVGRYYIQVYHRSGAGSTQAYHLSVAYE